MKRREFITNSIKATAGAMVLPYILPGGRLFAATGSRKANHVVFCLFAGGVRNFESVQKAEGNLMPSILYGTEPISSDIASAMSPLPASPFPQALQAYGTLYKEFRYGTGPTGHYNGHTTSITGTYTQVDLNIRDHPASPTIFEYYRKHNATSQSAMNTWWVANTLGPYPALNYSKDINYGVSYGANFIAPTFLISPQGYDALGNMKTFTSAEEAIVTNMRQYVNSNFALQYLDSNAGIINDAPDVKKLQDFILDKFNKAVAGQYTNPWNLASPNIMSNDMYNILFAEEIIKEFTPELLVVNMQDVDVCHSNFTGYCDNLRKADYAVAHLWNTIQSTPGMANDTILIVAPEHGRNLLPNTIVDQYGRKALDHTSDQTSREIFCLILGPPNVVKQNNVITAVKGESIDIVPTIANILGFDTSISNSPPGSLLYDAFY